MRLKEGISFCHRASKNSNVQFANNIFRMTDCLQNTFFSFFLMKYFFQYDARATALQTFTTRINLFKTKNVVNKILKLNERYFLLQ